MKEKIGKYIFIAIIIFGLVYGVIIEPILESKHCKRMAREYVKEKYRYKDIDYTDIDYIIDDYEYFYNLCREHN